MAGGLLAAGSQTSPHPGRINISFPASSFQSPTSPSLLVYGKLSLHGLPRPPAWTLLAAAAKEGATGELRTPCQTSADHSAAAFSSAAYVSDISCAELNFHVSISMGRMLPHPTCMQLHVCLRMGCAAQH